MKWGLSTFLALLLLMSACSIGDKTDIAKNIVSDITDDDNLSNSVSEVVNMKILSPVFEDNSMIPKLYTCQGQDINPPLRFVDVPEDTESLALIMDDPDAPMGTWDHWVLFNIPPDVTGIPEDSVPEESTQGMNSWPKNSYGGPVHHQAHIGIFSSYMP
jgi:phosphatidylethanolamine-binding protein (PEBP) family uncharacterized protein